MVLNRPIYVVRLRKRNVLGNGTRDPGEEMDIAQARDGQRDWGKADPNKVVDRLKHLALSK